MYDYFMYYGSDTFSFLIFLDDGLGSYDDTI